MTSAPQAINLNVYHAPLCLRTMNNIYIYSRSGYNNYSYLGYTAAGCTAGMTGSAYNTSASLAASYGSAVLDPLLQASSLASAASAQTTSGEWERNYRGHSSVFVISCSLLLEGNG